MTIRRADLRTYILPTFLLIFACGVFLALPLPVWAQDEGSVIGNYIAGGIYSLCLAIGGGFLWLFGMLFDFSIGYLVIGMGELIRNQGLGITIDAIWTIIRDIFNLLFIFGILWIGFQIILGIGSRDTKKMLVMLIAAALLINFSLYITKAVVDISNVTAYQIYNLIEVEGASGVTYGEYTGIASGFMEYLNLETSADQNGTIIGAAAADQGNLGPWRLILYGIMVMMFALITAFVFAAGAIFLIVRFVALVLFMMFSPAMFLGLIFPGLQSYSSRWWKGFISYALMAPALIFMLYLSLAAARELQSGGTFVQALSDPSGHSGAFQIILMFSVIIGFVIASLSVAKKLGDVGAAQAGNAASWAQKKLYGGMSGFAGRNTIGRVADSYDRMLEERGVSKHNWLRSASRAGAEAKFGGSVSRQDTRKASEEAGKKKARYNELQKTHGAVTASVGRPDDEETRIEMEQRVKGSTTEQLTETLQNKKLGSAEYDAVVASMTASQFDNVMKAKEEDFDDDQKAKLGAQRSVAVASFLRDEAQKAHKDETGDPDAELEEEEALQKGISKADQTQLKALGFKTLSDHAGHLTPSQLEDIKKSNDYTQTEKSRLAQAYESKITERFDKAPGDVLGGKKESDIAKMPKKILKDARAAKYLTGNALKKIADDTTLTPEDRLTLKKNVLAAGKDAPESAHKFLLSSRGQEIF